MASEEVVLQLIKSKMYIDIIVRARTFRPI